MDYKEMAEIIVTGVGGKDNILAIKSCATRIKVKTIDSNKVNRSLLDNDNVTKGFFESSEWLHLIVGVKNISPIMKEIKSLVGDIGEDSSSDANVSPIHSQEAADVDKQIASELISAIQHFRKAYKLFIDSIH